MPDPNLDYDPVTGFLDTNVFVTNPATQTATRTLFQRLFTQVQTFLNTTLIGWINATFATKTELTGVALGAIPDDSVTEAKMANEMKKAVAGGVESYNTANTHRSNAAIHVSSADRIAWDANDTAANILTKIKTVDGAGSGLDADLLDGQHAAYFASAAALTASRQAVMSSMANNTYVGDTVIITSSFVATQYDLMTTAYTKAKGDADATMPATAMYIIGVSDTRLLLKKGYYKNTAWSFTKGEPIWVSPSTAGGLTQTKPTTSGQRIQCIGYAEETDVIYVDFNTTWGEVA